MDVAKMINNIRDAANDPFTDRALELAEKLAEIDARRKNRKWNVSLDLRDAAEAVELIQEFTATQRQINREAAAQIKREKARKTEAKTEAKIAAGNRKDHWVQTSS